MRLSTVVERLRTACPSLVWIELALKSAIPTNYPAAFVFPLAETPQANSLASAMIQRVPTHFAVELMVKHTAAAGTGGPAAELLEDVRDEVRAALLGWVPLAGVAPLEFAGGQLLDFTAGIATWRDQFSTSYFIRPV